MDPGTDPDYNPEGGTNPPPDCDPSIDPKCEKPLTSTDSTTIQSALRQFVRPDTAIADTANRRRCRDMLDKFLERFDSDKVFRGTYDSQSTDGHYGAMLSGRIHFDPWLLNDAAKGIVSAQRELANTALHEAAHVLGFRHNAGADANGHYSDPPFNLLDPGPNVCIR